MRSDYKRGQETKGKTSSVDFGQGCHLLPPVYLKGVDYQLWIIMLSHLQNLLMRCGVEQPQAQKLRGGGSWSPGKDSSH